MYIIIYGRFCFVFCIKWLYTDRNILREVIFYKNTHTHTHKHTLLSFHSPFVIHHHHHHLLPQPSNHLWLCCFYSLAANLCDDLTCFWYQELSRKPIKPLLLLPPAPLALHPSDQTPSTTPRPPTRVCRGRDGHLLTEDCFLRGALRRGVGGYHGNRPLHADFYFHLPPSPLLHLWQPPVEIDENTFSIPLSEKQTHTHTHTCTHN